MDLSVHRLAICTIQGYIFWSLLYGIFPLIWFYPLNELDFTGYELFLVTCLIPAVTASERIFKLLRSHYVIILLNILMMCGIGSFQAPTTLTRLTLLSVGTSAVLLHFISSVTNPFVIYRITYCWGIVLGYFVVLVSRIFYVSVFPTWSDAYSNMAVVTFGFISLIDAIVTGITCFFMQKNDRPEIIKSGDQDRKSVFTFGVGFGSLLFLTHWIFGEVSVLARWVVDGHPNSGPDPNLSGCLTLAAMILGVIISPRVLRLNLFARFCYWLTSGVAFMLLYTYRGYTGFAGGLYLAVFVMSIWPLMLGHLSSRPRLATTGMFVAMVTYLLEMVLLVWTVAYNFVPGGEYTREHTDYLIIIIIVNIGLFLYSYARSVMLVEYSKVPSKVYICLLLLGLLGCTELVHRYFRHPLINQSVEQTKSCSSKEFTSAIWTYHFAYDNRGWPSLERSAQFINDTGADVITLLESDASKPFLGNNDLTTWLSERLGLYSDFGPSTRDHTWGTMLLSKYPIVQSKHHLLPSPRGELAPAISATINISGRMIDFVVSHMGNDGDVLDRKLQAEYLADLLNKSLNPVVLLAYVTSSPYSDNYQTLINDGRVKDIDDTDMSRWCEYIMYRGLQRLGYARVSHGGLSDTELQMAKFRIPDSSPIYEDFDDYVYDGRRVPECQRFNDNFRFGEFLHGHNWDPVHKFHMRTPKYFTKMRSASTKP